MAGAGAFVPGLSGSAVPAASASLLADAYVAGDPSALLLSGVLGNLGLGADLLLGLWLAAVGAAWWPARPAAGLALLAVGAGAVSVVALKVTGAADPEPTLGLVFALAFLGIGALLLRPTP